MKYPAPVRFRVNPRADRRRAAYTRSELLVILVVIVVLVWLCTPYLPRVHPKQHQSSCASNMKRIGMAFGQYLTDNDGMYPAYDSIKTRITGLPPQPYSNVSSERGWYTVLQPYLSSTSSIPSSENDNVLRCPADTSRAPVDPKNPDLDRKKEYVSSYSVNGWSEYALEQSAVTSPASWVLMGERNSQALGPRWPWMFYFWTWQGEPVVWPPVATPVPTEKAAEDLALTQHSTGANWLYGDGHVRWTPFSRLWKGGSENPFSPGAVASPQFSGS